MNYINIKFDDIWETSFFKIDERDRDVFENGFVFEYNEETTFLDLMKILNSKIYYTLNKCEEEQTNDLKNEQNLKYLYRIIEYDKAIYILFLDTKIKRYIDEYKKESITISSPIFVEKGGGIHRENGLDFFVHSKEQGRHNFPHVHVRCSGKEAEIYLDGTIKSGNLPMNKLKIAKQIIENNRYEFSLAWNTQTDAIRKIDLNDLDRII